MMWQLADNETLTATPGERAYIMEKAKPPPNWWVFVGQYDGGQWDEKLMYTGFDCLHEPEREGDRPEFSGRSCCHSFISTFGKVVFNTLSISDSAVSMFKRFPVEYATQHRLQIIWPLSESNTHQFDRSHSDAELLEIANFFYRV